MVRVEKKRGLHKGITKESYKGKSLKSEVFQVETINPLSTER
jgi:hypothetical protein